jgi:hypothetical protein
MDTQTARNDKMKLTEKQQAAYDQLCSGYYVKSIKQDNPNFTVYSTGIDSRVLGSLKKKGLIDCKCVFLGGFVADLEVIHDLNGFEPDPEQEEKLAQEYRTIKLYGAVF